MPAICVDRVSKRYRLGHRRSRSLRVHMEDTLRGLWRPRDRAAVAADFWALRDVSLEVERGEVVSLVGRNGAGKSTLLKILARITEPTAGRAELHGRVGSLLEVGTGFHGELTGRENIYLNAAILGMKRAEIARKFDAIVDFAEIDGFIDTPVKRYSSGMFVRLAFAVAAHLEPEILLVDEVLAVGDAGFQRKCLGTIDAAVREGRTVIFVSHDMAAVTALSRRALLLDRGRVTATGPVRDVVQTYLESVAEDGDRGLRVLQPAPDLPLAVTTVRTIGPDGALTAFVGRSAEVTIILDGEVRRPADPGEEYFVAIDIRGADGVLLFRTHNVERRAEASIPRREGAFSLACRVPPDLLPAGTYQVGVLSGIAGKVELQEVPRTLELHVVQDLLLAGLWTGSSGLLTPHCEWHAA